MSDAEIKPVMMVWDGVGMLPVARAAALASKQFAVGETYFMDIVRGRSMRSHDHYFVVVENGWQNISDEARERFPTVDHLRKYLLIKAGYCDVETFPCSSRSEAIRWASSLRKIDQYALVLVADSSITRYTAHSQSKQEMGAKVFQESKTATLAILADLLEVTAAELMGASV